jgi:hypothetical protein
VTRGSTPPPLEADPLALALGIVPDPGRRLSRLRLKSGTSRPASSQTCSPRAAGTSQRRPSSGGRWPPAPTSRPRCLQPSQKSCGSPQKNSLLRQVTATLPHRRYGPQRQPRQFAGLARRWARTSGQSLADARTGLQRLMLVTTARRGRHLTAKEWLPVLEDFIEASSRDEGTEVK